MDTLVKILVSTELIYFSDMYLNYESGIELRFLTLCTRALTLTLPGELEFK
jgi:hypothetical protein